MNSSDRIWPWLLIGVVIGLVTLMLTGTNPR